MFIIVICVGFCYFFVSLNTIAMVVFIGLIFIFYLAKYFFNLSIPSFNRLAMIFPFL